MRGGSYLLRRQGRAIAFRCRVPIALIGVVGKREIVRSLGTEHTRLARVVAAAIGLRLSDLWYRVGSMEPQNKVARLIEAWFKRELDEAFRHYHGGDLTQAPATKALIDDIQDDVERQNKARSYAMQLAEHDLEQLQEDHKAGSYGRGYEAANAIIGGLDLPFDQSDQRLTVVAREVLSAQAAIADSRFRWADGDVGYHPKWSPELPEALFPKLVIPPTVAPPPPTPASPTVKLAGKTIRQAFEAYARAKNIRSYQDFNTAIRRFIEIHGDIDVALIERRHIIEYRDLLLVLPVRKPSKLRTSTVREIVALYADSATTRRLSAQTVNNKALAALSAVFNFAFGNGWISGNPASRVVAEKPRSVSGSPPVIPYTLSDLKALFNSPVFIDGARPVGGAGEAAVWLPTLALYTGARLEELGGLKVGDVLIEDAVRYLFIRQGKTAAARRKIPIHSALVDLGFLDYVAVCGTKPTNALFPLLKSAKVQTTGSWSKWWGRYARIYVPEENKVFHSFRHTVKRKLRNEGCEKVLMDAVMGHDANDVASKYGLDEEGQGFTLTVLAPVIEKLHYEGLVICMKKSAPCLGSASKRA